MTTTVIPKITFNAAIDKYYRLKGEYDTCYTKRCEES